MEDYYDDVKMPGSRLKIGFHGDGKTSEQIFVIPSGRGRCQVFRDQGLEGGRQARNKMRHGQSDGLGSANRIPRGSL